MNSPGVLVPSFGRVAEEGGISHVLRFLPMLISRVPREVRDEASFENPVNGGFFTWGQQVFGKLERCPMSFLGEHSNRRVSLQGDDDVLNAGGLDAVGGGGPSERPGSSRGLGCFNYLINPFMRGDLASFPLVDPVPHLWSVVGGGQVLGNVGDDEIFVLHVDEMKAHPKCRSTFPVLRLGVPEVPDPGAASVGERVAFIFFAKPKRSAFLVSDEGVPEYRLLEQFCDVGRF